METIIIAQEDIIVLRPHKKNLQLPFLLDSPVKVRILPDKTTYGINGTISDIDVNNKSKSNYSYLFCY